MNITPGTRLGRYEIRSKIGEGGMGEVYLAQDTRPSRDGKWFTFARGTIIGNMILIADTSKL